MSWVKITNTKTGKIKIIGDINQYKKSEGLPYVKPDGRYVSSQEIEFKNKDGE